MIYCLTYWCIFAHNYIHFKYLRKFKVDRDSFPAFAFTKLHEIVVPFPKHQKIEFRFPVDGKNLTTLLFEGINDPLIARRLCRVHVRPENYRRNNDACLSACTLQLVCMVERGALRGAFFCISSLFYLGFSIFLSMSVFPFHLLYQFGVWLFNVFPRDLKISFYANRLVASCSLRFSWITDQYDQRYLPLYKLPLYKILLKIN